MKTTLIKKNKNSFILQIASSWHLPDFLLFSLPESPQESFPDSPADSLASVRPVYIMLLSSWSDAYEFVFSHGTKILPSRI